MRIYSVLRDFVQDITQKRLNLFHVMVHQRGELLEKFDWIATDNRDNMHSASKSIMGLAAGIAIDEGYLTMDSKPAEILAAHLPKEYPEALDRVTLRHLLTMSVGRKSVLMPGYSNDPSVLTRDNIENPDWINYVFSQPIYFEPGTHFMYDNSSPYLVSAMIQEVTGQTALNYLKPRLFQTMGIKNAQWLTDPDGRTVGAGGLMLNTDEYSRFGRLFLAGGRWEGKQLVSESFIAEAVKHQITCHPEKTDGADPSVLVCRHNYGYYLWRFNRDDIYFMSGWGGQGCVMIPGLDACVTFKAHEFQGDAVLTSIYRNVIPRLKETYSGLLEQKSEKTVEPSAVSEVKEVSPWG